MKKFPTITTERLLLNEVQESDVPDIVGIFKEEEVSEFTLSIPYPYAAKDAMFWLGLAQKGFANKDMYVFAIRQQETEKIIGGIDLSLNIKHNKGELGYWLGKPYWNKGFMTEAAQALVEFGFETLGLKKIFASHLVDNPASGKVMKKIGMEKEGVLKCYTKKGDVYNDHVFYGVIR